jgi:hypothetical protein
VLSEGCGVRGVQWSEECDVLRVEGVTCGVRSVKNKVWSVQYSVVCGVLSVEWKFYSVECGVYSGECRVWGEECKV